MTKRPYILITNDDGIHASGLRHLWHAIKDHADASYRRASNGKIGKRPFDYVYASFDRARSAMGNASLVREWNAS